VLLVEYATGNADGIYPVVAVLFTGILCIGKTCRYVFFCSLLRAQFMGYRLIGVDFLFVAMKHFLVGFERNKFQ